MQGTADKTMVNAHPNTGGLGEALSSRLVVTLVFVVFLATALVGAMLGQPWRSWLPGAEGVKSLTGGVLAAVYTLVGHLP